MTTLGIGSGAAIAGLLGMNLKNYMEDWHYGFPFITSMALGLSIIVGGYSFNRLKRIQKLTLYGRYPGIKRQDNECYNDLVRVSRYQRLKRKWQKLIGE